MEWGITKSRQFRKVITQQKVLLTNQKTENKNKERNCCFWLMERLDKLDMTDWSYYIILILFSILHREFWSVLADVKAEA